ncbi:MAG: nitroreductase [Alphaproteobacteria bacterium]|nr:nitroreductase [Alphaproteobacteria bacterium]
MNNEPALNKASPETLDFLLSRRSGTAKAMTGPGPDEAELRRILQAAARVPDHGKLFPWRFVVFGGDGRARMGALLARFAAEDGAEEKSIALEKARFLRAPVVVGVISRVQPGIKIPEWEQMLSAGAVCQTMLIAAHALGYVANWLTEWCAYDARVASALGLQAGERIAGFVYIGTSAVKLEERPRPDMNEIVTWF